MDGCVDAKRIKIESSSNLTGDKGGIKEEYDDIYERYDFTRAVASNLPILSKTSEILAKLESNNIIIIQGNF